MGWSGVGIAIHAPHRRGSAGRFSRRRSRSAHHRRQRLHTRPISRSTTSTNNKTQSGIKTRSYPDGPGYNELRFEDKKGEEHVYLQGEKDWNILIKNDKGQNIGHDEALSVANNRTKSVGVNQSETIGANKDIQIGANHTETIGAEHESPVAGQSPSAPA